MVNYARENYTESSQSFMKAFAREKSDDFKMTIILELLKARVKSGIVGIFVKINLYRLSEVQFYCVGKSLLLVVFRISENIF